MFIKISGGHKAARPWLALVFTLLMLAAVTIMAWILVRDKTSAVTSRIESHGILLGIPRGWERDDPWHHGTSRPEALWAYGDEGHRSSLVLWHLEDSNVSASRVCLQRFEHLHGSHDAQMAAAWGVFPWDFIHRDWNIGAFSGSVLIARSYGYAVFAGQPQDPNGWSGTYALELIRPNALGLEDLSLLRGIVASVVFSDTPGSGDQAGLLSVIPFDSRA